MKDENWKQSRNGCNNCKHIVCKIVNVPIGTGSHWEHFTENHDENCFCKKPEPYKEEA